MANLYEIITIISPNESEEGVNAIIGGLRQQIDRSDAEILNVDLWGRKKLAYDIQKFEEGIFVLMHVEGPPTFPAEFKAYTKIREAILREMVVRLEDAQERDVRDHLRKQGAEDEDVAEAQIAAAEKRAEEKKAAAAASVSEKKKAKAEEAADDGEQPEEAGVEQEEPGEDAGDEDSDGDDQKEEDEPDDEDGDDEDADEDDSDEDDESDDDGEDADDDDEDADEDSEDGESRREDG